MATTAIKQQEPRKKAAKDIEQPEKGTAETPDKVVKTFDEVRVRMQKAYSAYLEGQRDLELVFKERDRQDEDSYKEVERRLQVYEAAIDKAVKGLEKAQQEAFEVYRQNVDGAIQKAGEVCRESMKQALRKCKETADQAWKSSKYNS